MLVILILVPGYQLEFKNQRHPNTILIFKLLVLVLQLLVYCRKGKQKHMLLFKYHQQVAMRNG